MSALRTRTAAVLAAAAIALPMGIALAGSASAASDPLAGLGLGGVTNGITGDTISMLDPVTGALPVGALPVGALPVGALPVGALPVGALPVGALGAGAPAGALAGTPADDLVNTATTALKGTPADGVLDKATGLTDGVLPGDLVPGGLADLPLEDTLDTVTETVDGVLKTVTRTVDGVLKSVDDTLDQKIVTRTKSQDVKSANVKKPAVVATGSLPHTGADANTTAMLLCAGLAVAGTGVTLVTRRRKGLGFNAA